MTARSLATKLAQKHNHCEIFIILDVASASSTYNHAKLFRFPHGQFVSTLALRAWPSPFVGELMTPVAQSYLVERTEHKAP